MEKGGRGEVLDRVCKFYVVLMLVALYVESDCSPANYSSSPWQC